MMEATRGPIENSMAWRSSGAIEQLQENARACEFGSLAQIELKSWCKIESVHVMRILEENDIQHRAIAN
jgi:hypothetical protein